MSFCSSMQSTSSLAAYSSVYTPWGAGQQNPRLKQTSTQRTGRHWQVDPALMSVFSVQRGERGVNEGKDCSLTAPVPLVRDDASWGCNTQRGGTQRVRSHTAGTLSCLCLCERLSSPNPSNSVHKLSPYPKLIIKLKKY